MYKQSIYEKLKEKEKNTNSLIYVLCEVINKWCSMIRCYCDPELGKYQPLEYEYEYEYQPLEYE